MNKRVSVLAAAAAAMLITGAAVAQAQPDETAPWSPMERMHNTEQMRELRDQMPIEAREQCDEMHEQMQSQLGSTGQMMGPMHGAAGIGPIQGMD